MNTLTRATAIATTELRLLARNRTVLFSASLFPLALAGWLISQRDETRNASVALLGLNLVFFATFTIYTTVTTTIVARRDDLYLKRLRSGETSDSTILIGLVAPVVALCAVQLGIVYAVMFGIGVTLPPNPVPLVLAVVGTFAVCASVAVLTAVFTPTVSASQISSMPFLLLVVGSFMLAPQLESKVLDFLPGGAVVTLVRAAYEVPIEGSVLTASIGLALWAYIAYNVARRRFAWEPRR